MDRTEGQIGDATGRRSPDEIRRDIERTREGMHETVEALEQRLSPGELFEEVWDRMRSGGGGVGDVVKDHPVPLALMGLGIGWLAIEKATSSRGDQLRRHHGDVDTDRIGRAEGRVGPYRGDEITGTTVVDDRGLTDKLGSAASGVKEKAGDLLSGAKDSVAHAGDDVGERAAHLKEDASEKARRARSGLERLSQEQPMVMGAITFGLGLAAGLAAPSTHLEEELLGEKAARVKQSAKSGLHEVKDDARELVEEVKDVGGEAIRVGRDSAHEHGNESLAMRAAHAVDAAKETAGEAARREGLDSQGLKERVRETAGEATETAKREMRS